jgi:hypothetical protein
VKALSLPQKQGEGKMLRNAASKVAWVGRTASMVFGLALVLALLFGVASMALGANGNPFILGKANNTASTVTGLVGNVADTTKAALKVTNTKGGSALELKVTDPDTTDPALKDTAPMTVDSQAKVANLNADELDGEDSAAFQKRLSGECAVGSSIRSIDANGLVTCEPDDDLSGDAAGGDLTGTYPNPAIANNAVNSDKVANGSLVLADLQGVGTSAGGSFNFTVPANGCDAPFDIGIGTASPFQVGDLVVWKVTQGTLPDGLYMPAVSVTRTDRIPQLFCNVTSSTITVSGSFTFGVRAVR